MPLSLRPHEYKTAKGRATLTRVNPYCRLFAEDGPPVFIQGGHFYSEGGKEIEEKKIPDWVWDEVAKLDETVKQEIGLSKQSDRNSITAGSTAKAGAK